MEKALEILNNIYFDDRGIMCIEKSTALDVFNAIAGLEEAMKTKTCEGCKWLAIGKYCTLPVGTCIRKSDDYFETKDNA